MYQGKPPTGRGTGNTATAPRLEGAAGNHHGMWSSLNHGVYADFFVEQEKKPKNYREWLSLLTCEVYAFKVYFVNVSFSKLK